MSLSEPARARLLVAGLALAAFAPALTGAAWVIDDRPLILENALLHGGWGALGELLTTGYWSAVQGEHAAVHQWRPLLSLSFLLQIALTGFDPIWLRLVNLLLHAAASLLVLANLRDRLGPRAAAAGAAIFAVMPVHAESVVYITSRSELLGALAALGAWRLFPRRPLAGAAVYLAGSLCKEHVLLFPLFLALSDWSFERRRPWDPERRRGYLLLAGAAAFVLAGRALLLPGIAEGGHPYFESTPYLERLLTLSKFWAAHYLWPMATGLGLCADFSRPLIPDSGPGDAAAWAALLALAWALSRRSFWMLGPALFLLPTSNLIMDLDAIGAQRFLYLPSLGLAAGAGLLFARAERARAPAARAALAAALLWLGGRAATRSLDWTSEPRFYQAQTSCNPRSAKARTALGTALLREGRAAEGEAELRKSYEMEPLYGAAYNLARSSFERGDRRAARDWARKAHAAPGGGTGALVLEALLDEQEGRWVDAEKKLRRAILIHPLDPTPRFNIARVFALHGSPELAATELRAFIRLTRPGAERDAALLWLGRLEYQSRIGQPKGKR